MKNINVIIKFIYNKNLKFCYKIINKFNNRIILIKKTKLNYIYLYNLIYNFIFIKLKKIFKIINYNLLKKIYLYKIGFYTINIFFININYTINIYFFINI